MPSRDGLQTDERSERREERAEEVAAHNATQPGHNDDISVFPLAIPLIAGPSALATVMLLASREPAKLGMWGLSLTATMVIATVVLVTGDKLQRWMGERAMQAVERLMGLILTAIAVEMLLTGIKEFVQGL